MAKKSVGKAVAKVKAAAKSAGEVPGLKEWLESHRESVRLLDDEPDVIDVVSTGNWLVDNVVCGVGGLPFGRVVEIYGGESSGKTTLCLQTLIQAQQAGIPFLYHDTENDFDMRYFKRLGGSTKNFPLSQPESGEAAFNSAKSALKAGWPRIIVFDSVATMTPQLEVDGDMDTRDMGVHAKMMSKGMRLLRRLAKKRNCLLIFTNQTRQNPGMTFGNPETTPGGKALRFYASIRLELKSIGQIKVKGEVGGNDIRVRCVKNKVASPYCTAIAPSYFGKGLDNGYALFEVAAANGLEVSQEKSMWVVGGQKFRSRMDAMNAFRGDELLVQSVAASALELLRADKLELPGKGGGE